MTAKDAIRIAQDFDSDANYALRATGEEWHIYHLCADQRPTRYLGLLTYTLDKTNREPEPT
jgi:hypothetical protein